MSVIYKRKNLKLNLSCVNGLSDLIFQIGESCSSPLPLAACENARKPGFWQTKAYKSKTKINFADFFGYSKKESFVDII
jgi:hypothetical protein